MAKPILITALHDGVMKTLSMGAFAVELNVSDHFVKVRKKNPNITDQQIIDEAVSMKTSNKSVDELRSGFLFAGAAR